MILFFLTTASGEQRVRVFWEQVGRDALGGLVGGEYLAVYADAMDASAANEDNPSASPPVWETTHDTACCGGELLPKVGLSFDEK